MKIGHLDNHASVTKATKERKTGSGNAAAGDATAEPSAQVALSSAALGANGGVPEFDSDKVDRIAQAIRDGKFTVNADAIADKLISNAQELLGRGSH
jgi:negative regulator of flagellin synthesis FlgM